MQIEKDVTIKDRYFEWLVIHGINLNLREKQSFSFNFFENEGVRWKEFSFEKEVFCQFYSTDQELLEILSEEKNAVVVPMSKLKRPFNLLIFQYEDYKNTFKIYVVQILRNIEEHKSNDILFYEENHFIKYIEENYKKKIQWQYIWIYGNENYLTDEFFKSKMDEKLKFHKESWFVSSLNRKFGIF